MQATAFHLPLAFVRRPLLSTLPSSIFPIYQSIRRPSSSLIARRIPVPRVGSVGQFLRASLPSPVITSIATTLAYQASFFTISSIFRTDKLTDLAGTSNIALLAFISFITSSFRTIRHFTITGCITVWATRLGIFLFRRILRWRTDTRFDAFRDSLSQKAGFWALQACWVCACALPATLLTSAPPGPSLGLQDAVGFALFAVGFLLESVADAQKESAKTAGRWPRTGVWSTSRHPNYFGEIVLWWGIYVMAQPQLGSNALLALASPLTVSVLLMFVSGVPLLENRADERYGHLQEYLRYKKQTSVLLPIPPAIYHSLPVWVKRWVLLDFPMYNSDRTSQRSPE